MRSCVFVQNRVILYFGYKLQSWNRSFGWAVIAWLVGMQSWPWIVTVYYLHSVLMKKPLIAENRLLQPCCFRIKQMFDFKLRVAINIDLEILLSFNLAVYWLIRTISGSNFYQSDSFQFAYAFTVLWVPQFLSESTIVFQSLCLINRSHYLSNDTSSL